MGPESRSPGTAEAVKVVGENPSPDRSFFRSSLVIFFITSSGSVFGLLFQAAAVKMLDAREYGILGALLALAIYLCIPGQAIQLVFSRHASRSLAVGDVGRVRGLARQMFAIAAGLSVVYLTALLLFAPRVSAFYNLSGFVELGMTLALGVVMLYYYLGLGALQALQHFGLYGTCQAGLSLSKLVIGGGLAWLGWGLIGVFAGLLLGPLAILASVTRHIRRDLTRVTPRPSGISTHELLLEGLPLLFTFGGFTVLFNLDITFVQNYFGGAESKIAGLYNAAATLGKAVLYLPLAIVTVTFAKVSAAEARGEPHVHFLVKNLALTLILSGIGIAGLGLFPEWCMFLFTGDEEYAQAVPLLKRYLLPMALFGVVAVFMNYFFALGHRSFAGAIVVASIVAPILFERRHATPDDIIDGLIWISVGLTVVSFLLVPWYQWQRSKRRR